MRRPHLGSVARPPRPAARTTAVGNASGPSECSVSEPRGTRVYTWFPTAVYTETEGSLSISLSCLYIAPQTGPLVPVNVATQNASRASPPSIAKRPALPLAQAPTGDVRWVRYPVCSVHHAIFLSSLILVGQCFHACEAGAGGATAGRPGRGHSLHTSHPCRGVRGKRPTVELENLYVYGWPCATEVNHRSRETAEMPPKKDGKKDAKKGSDLTPEEKVALIEQTLEGEKNNLVSTPVPCSESSSCSIPRSSSR